jgi:hypothetical protein
VFTQAWALHKHARPYSRAEEGLPHHMGLLHLQSAYALLHMPLRQCSVLMMIYTANQRDPTLSTAARLSFLCICLASHYWIRCSTDADDSGGPWLQDWSTHRLCSSS